MAVAAVLVAGLALTVWLVGTARQPGAVPTSDLSVEERSAAAPTIEVVEWQPLRRGRWRELPRAPLTPRVAHDMEWTGSRVLVWGGFDVAGRPLAGGGLFDPATGTWESVDGVDTRESPGYAAPFGDDVVVVSTAGTQRYDPSADSWQVEARLPPLKGYTLTDQVVAFNEGVAAVLRPTANSDGPPAVFTLHPDDVEWRRLPDPAVQFAKGDVLLGAEKRLLVFTRARDGEPAAGLSIDVTSGDARWQQIEIPPGMQTRPLDRLFGAHVGARIVLVGIGARGTAGYAAVHDAQRWRRLDPPPLRPSSLADALTVGDDVVLWDRLTGTGALLDLEAAQWTRLPPAPIGDGAPRPAVSTGSTIVTWGHFVAKGAIYRVR